MTTIYFVSVAVISNFIFIQYYINKIFLGRVWCLYCFPKRKIFRNLLVELQNEQCFILTTNAIDMLTNHFFYLRLSTPYYE